MKTFIFRYECIDKDFKVEIKAINLNEAMIRFATHYKQIQQIYSAYEKI